MEACQGLAQRRLAEWSRKRNLEASLLLSFGTATIKPGVPLSLEELIREAERLLCDNKRSNLALVPQSKGEAAGRRP
jgi:PleD family two-component response regulator